MNNTQKNEYNRIAKDMIFELTKNHFSVDCWSIKGSGDATKDCDIAIDIKGHYDVEDLPFKNKKDFVTDINPYNVDENNKMYKFTRVKFTFPEISMDHIAQLTPGLLS